MLINLFASRSGSVQAVSAAFCAAKVDLFYYMSKYQ